MVKGSVPMIQFVYSVTIHLADHCYEKLLSEAVSNRK